MSRQYGFAYQCLVTAIVALGTLVNGINKAWMLAYIPQLEKGEPFQITEAEKHWIVLSQSLGGLFGSILALFSNNIDRKVLLLGTSCLFLISSLQLAFAMSGLVVCIARFVFGIAAALSFLFSCIYVAEVVDYKIRGAMVATAYLLWSMSYLISYGIGQYLTIEKCGYVSIICILSFMITFLWMPESPYFLSMTNQIELAEKSLKKLRRKENVHEELLRIARGIERTKEIYKTNGLRKNCKAFKILLTVLNAECLSGGAAMANNAEVIYETFFDIIGPVTLTKICYSSKIIGGFLCIFIVEIWGRKLGMTFSLIIFGITLVLLGFYLFIKVNCVYHLSADHQYVVLLFVVLNGLAIGILTTIPLVTLSEIFPLQYKALGCAIYGLVLYGYMIITQIVIVFIRNYFLLPGFFFIFASCFMFAILNQVVVFETKGKTLEEIQERLETYIRIVSYSAKKYRVFEKVTLNFLPVPNKKIESKFQEKATEI